MRKKRAQNRRKGSSSTSGGHGWAWLLFGVVLGGVLGSIGYVKWYEGRPHTVPPIAEAKKVINKIPKPQFDFYTLLPDAEVEATRSPSAPPKPKVPAAVADNQKNAPASAATGPYRLQLAAFKNFHDADALKAKLALSGFTVEIQSVTLEGGTVWYRVQTPALKTQQEALQMQSALKSAAITSVLIK
ncbi:MAG: SPOR domain-containing protein [Gammaproteobacteria bacterium]